MGEMFRRLLVWAVAATCLAQPDGSATKKDPPVEVPKQPCRRAPPRERIAPPEVDRKMAIPLPKSSGDEKMVITPPQVCPDKQG